MVKNIIDYFERTKEKYPGKIAVIDGAIKLSFSELEFQAKCIAKQIVKYVGSLRNMPVAVYLEKSHYTATADLGISYSSNFFMNLDIKMPEERVQAILQHVEPAVLITNKTEYQKIAMIIEKAGQPIQILVVEDVLNGKLSDSDSHLLYDRLELQIDTDPSCVINTSGSTGIPKGVVLNHKSFCDFLEWSIETFSLDEKVVMGSLSPSVFDIFVYELWLMAAKGAAIVILNSNLAMFPIKLLEQVKNGNVNFIFWVPSIMVNIANMDLLTKNSLENLKLIWFAGEVFPTKQFNYWKKCLPNTTFVNLYGPIEITLDCTYYIVDREFDDSEPLPIGYPCRNTDILILNSEDQLCRQGEEGELCVRGTSLAMGYYKDQKKTEKAFVQNPLNPNYPELIYRTGDIVYLNKKGQIVFKGRKDSLIKHMGYRIELGELEHAVINKLKLAEYCCVVYNHRQKEITLFYEASKDIEAGVFRKKLMTLFPKYMIPLVYIRRESLPRNTNGKIDRQKLSEEVNG